MKDRRYDIDWLRVIAMLGVFVLHCTRFFCDEDWHLKVPPAQQSQIWAILRGVAIDAWVMPLFFLISGYATRYSLRHRTPGQYLVERARRLLIPLYTVGLFILIPPQAYFERLTHGQISGTFWQWLPGFYLGLPREMLSTPQLSEPTSLVPYSFEGHLWFIQMLFVIVVLTLPVLLYLKSAPGARLIDRLAAWCARPGGIFLFAIPLAVVAVGLRWLPTPGYRTWVDFLWYALFFVTGFVISADARFTASIVRHGWLSLALWLGLFLGVGGVFTLVLGFEGTEGQGFSLLYVIWQLASAVVVWSSVVFMLSVGARYLAFTNRVLVYSGEAVLPFYLLHQTIILIVGWFVLPLPIGTVAMFLIIGLVSFPLILLLYEVFVRRIPLMRFLFGMAPQPQRRPAAAPSPTAA